MVIQEGDFIELEENAGFQRGGLRTFDHDGELHRMQARVLEVGSNLIRIQRDGAVRTKYGSYPMTEWINRSDVHGVVEPGLVPVRSKRYEQFWSDTVSDFS